MFLESVIGIECLGSQVESRWGGGVAEGGEKCRGGSLTDVMEAFADVDLPCGRGPSKAMFDSGVGEFRDDEDETCDDSHRVCSDIFRTGTIEVRWIWVSSYCSCSQVTGDCGVMKEYDFGALTVAEYRGS